MKVQSNFEQKIQQYEKYVQKAALIAGQLAVSFFKDNFRRQGFKDGGIVHPWRARANPLSGRNILIGQGRARLRSSIRLERSSSTFAVIATDVPYAEIHNNGGTIHQQVTAKQKAYFWAMFKRTKNDMWKRMALSSELHIQIPQRKFMGESTDLNEEILQEFQANIKKIFD